MANSKSITGNADGSNGENQSYTIKGRGDVSRAKLAREVDAGKHDGVHTIKVIKRTFHTVTYTAYIKKQ